ncbi:MAG: hypothetical protein HC837_17975 [Chloroflexaceae bacterium]|nr:hypothetical protein [Chloroflexaceae bacterium]
MSLTDILYDALDSVYGAQIAGVIGTDGLSVEMVITEDLPHEVEDAEFELSGLTAMAAASADRLGIGHVYDVILEAEELTYLASLISSGYYAVLGIRPESNLGRARFAVRQMVSQIQEEL